MKRNVLIISAILSCLSLALSPAELSYEQFLKRFVERLPKPLEKGETIADWWPFKDGEEYFYRISDARWDWNKKWVGTQFMIRFVQDPRNKAYFQFEIQGYDHFPFKGLQIDKNRIFLLDKNQVPNRIPLLVFPLFKDMLFADVNYEYEFLKKMVLNSSDSSFYAPVRSRFVTVNRVEGNRYYLGGAYPRDHFPYIFEKGIGIVKWTLPGGLTIEMIR
jgi:hypothetical protein